MAVSIQYLILGVIHGDNPGHRVEVGGRVQPHPPPAPTPPPPPAPTPPFPNLGSCCKQKTVSATYIQTSFLVLVGLIPCGSWNQLSKGSRFKIRPDPGAVRNLILPSSRLTGTIAVVGGLIPTSIVSGPFPWGFCVYLDDICGCRFQRSTPVCFHTTSVFTRGNSD